MSRKASFTALGLLCLLILPGAVASEPARSSIAPASPQAAQPAAAAPAAAPASEAPPAWLLPARGQSLTRVGVDANPGAILLNGCTNSCLATYSACNAGCNGNQRCIQVCNNAYHCCLQTCNPQGPQCP